MTILIFQTDSYLNKFEALVTQIDEANHAVILDQSAFYPGGGGQPYDTGFLTFNNNTITVTRARKAGPDVLHFIDPGEPLPPLGAMVTGTLNWDRRYKLMRTHTALHVLCGVVFRDYGALVTGGDMDPLEGRMDFEFETMQKELVLSIQEAVNREIDLNRSIRTSILPREKAFQIPDLIRTKINLLPEGIEQVRTVEIEGLDLQADGGTHVHATGEVGPIRVVDYKSKGKINKRIYIALQA
jgi:misacylated tRNA(Ala) deacylase